MLLFKKYICIFLIRGIVFTMLFGFTPSQTLAGVDDFYEQNFLSQIGLKNPSPNLTNEPVTVAIIDQGVDFQHPELTGMEWKNSKEIFDNQDNDTNNFSDDISGWNFLDNSNTLTPQGSHGTKLSGVIKIISKKSGIEIKIMSLIACAQNTGCNVPAVAKAIYYATDNGAKIINLSLGTDGYDSRLDEAILYAFKKNVVIVAAAGNGNSKGQGIFLDQNSISPICNDLGNNMILGVSASDSKNNPTTWANFGSCIDILAPAENIYTTFTPKFDDNLYYGYVEGSSYSAAEVAGIAAIIISKKPGLTNAQVYNAIILGAEKGNNFPSNFGNGSLNLTNSLNILNQEFTQLVKIVNKKPKILGANTKRTKLYQKITKVKKFSKKPRG
jgi:subtilisin family serine protease